MRYSFLSFLLFAFGCTSPIAALQDRHETSVAIHELQSELAELRHLLHNTQVELQILDEEVKKQERTQVNPKPSASLEQKINRLAMQVGDLERAFDQQKKALGEISSLKATLSSLLASLEKGESQTLYKVKAGDSLEKIARLHKVSVTALKEANNLSQTKIVVGQELKIPSTE